VNGDTNVKYVSNQTCYRRLEVASQPRVDFLIPYFVYTKELHVCNLTSSVGQPFLELHHVGCVYQ